MTSSRRIDVNTTSFLRHVPTGMSFELVYISGLAFMQLTFQGSLLCTCGLYVLCLAFIVHVLDYVVYMLQLTFK